MMDSETTNILTRLQDKSNGNPYLARSMRLATMDFDSIKPKPKPAKTKPLKNRTPLKERFGVWVVISAVQTLPRQNGKTMHKRVICRCDCGNTESIDCHKLIYSRVPYCGKCGRRDER